MIRTASELRHGTLRNKARRNQMRQRLMERDGTLCHWCDAEIALENSSKAIQSMTKCIETGEHVETAPPLDKFERKNPAPKGPEQET